MVKILYSFIFIFFLKISFAQTQVIDSAQYNLGKTIGDNIPVAILMILAIIFIFKTYRRNED